MTITVRAGACPGRGEPVVRPGENAPGSTRGSLAEGLLRYLPAAAERRLISTVDRLAAPGSCLAFEVKLAVEHRAGPIYRSAKEQIDVDLTALFDAEPRPDSAGALRTRGWATPGVRRRSAATRSRRAPQLESEAMVMEAIHELT